MNENSINRPLLSTADDGSFTFNNPNPVWSPLKVIIHYHVDEKEKEQKMSPCGTEVDNTNMQEVAESRKRKRTDDEPQNGGKRVRSLDDDSEDELSMTMKSITIKVHPVLLSMASPVWKAQLSSPWKEQQDSKLIFQVSDSDNANYLHGLIESIHSRIIPCTILTSANALCSYLLLADQYQVTAAQNSAIDELHAMIERESQSLSKSLSSCPSQANFTAVTVINKLRNHTTQHIQTLCDFAVTHCSMVLKKLLEQRRKSQQRPRTTSTSNLSSTAASSNSIPDSLIEIVTGAIVLQMSPIERHMDDERITKLDVESFVHLLSDSRWGGNDETSFFIMMWRYIAYQLQVGAKFTRREMKRIIATVRWGLIDRVYLSYLIQCLNFGVDGYSILFKLVREYAQEGLLFAALSSVYQKERIQELEQEVKLLNECLIDYNDPLPLRRAQRRLTQLSPRVVFPSSSTLDFTLTISSDDLLDNLEQIFAETYISSTNVQVKYGWLWNVELHRMWSSKDNQTELFLYPCFYLTMKSEYFQTGENRTPCLDIYWSLNVWNFIDRSWVEGVKIREMMKVDKQSSRVDQCTDNSLCKLSWFELRASPYFGPKQEIRLQVVLEKVL